MADWEGKSKGNKTGYGIFIGILKTMGVFPAYCLLVFVAAYYFLFSWTSSRHILYLFRRRLGMGLGTSLVKLYSNYFWFGQAIIDRIVMMAGVKNRFTFNFDGEEHLHQMVADGRGGHLLKRLNTKINIVMFDGEHQQLKQYLENTTGQRNANIIVIKDNISHVYEIMEALNKNELVCMHSDRFLPGNKTLSTDFLGQGALFPQGPFALASKFDVPVSFVFATKESFTQYHFFATPAIVFRRQKESSAESILIRFVEAMSQKVKAYPTQWYNYYDFWKK